MNYANMIEEKSLKKTFIIATLTATIINAFGSAHGLVEKLQQKRRDQKQDEEIKKLHEEVGKKKDAKRPKSERGSSPDDQDLDRSLVRSGRAIQNVYNMEFDRMGQKFAMGDVITQNELQAQIIQLQQTVISILEEAVFTGQKPSRADMAILFQASESARENSIKALYSQHSRLIANAPHGGANANGFHTPLNGHKPMLALRAPPSHSSVTGSNHAVATTIATRHPNPDIDLLFCRYSIALQDNRDMPLSRAFTPGGDARCDACHFTLPIEPQRAWQIYVADPSTKQGDRKYHVLNRFMVKCHRADGEFACVLCSKWRTTDTIWEDCVALAKHLARAHDVVELDREIDIIEVPG